MNILLTIAFDGTAYHGFQVQQNALAIAQVLQDALQKLFGVRPAIKGCSRTDAGVHAENFCVSFKQQTNLPMQKLPLAINSYLPHDIRVLHARLVPENFHARYAAISKTYEYRILNRPVDDPFQNGRYYRYAAPLQINAMQQAAAAIIGKHDFCSFMSSGSHVIDTVRTVSRLQVMRRGDMVVISITADGFLYNMVRIIAGTLLAVGAGHMQAQQLPAIIAAKNRAAAGDTLPAKGLFLCKVEYPPLFLCEL